ncbi:MAG: DUF393 domain-containing protein [Salinarimonadaceae bacterium]|nr:MAG: DUF393 domain-containing protein [Salinarimonadaceae bacterium]
MTNTQEPRFTIFYDGACPLCAREIAFYRRRGGAERMRWVDVSASDEAQVAPGLSRETAIARFHAMREDGALVSGGAAFAEIMARLDGLRPIGRVLRRRPLRDLLDLAYRAFLPIRPRLQRLAGGRCEDACSPPPAKSP